MGHNIPFPFRMNLVLKIPKHGIRCLLTHILLPQLEKTRTRILKSWRIRIWTMDTCIDSLIIFVKWKTLIFSSLNSLGMTNSMCEIRLDFFEITRRSLWSIFSTSLFLTYVRLNLIKHFVGFIPCQFACNLALRNHIFRWESCKGSVWDSVKKCLRLCIEARTCDWISRVACDWQAAKGCTWVKHAEKLNHHASCSNTRQKV